MTALVAVMETAPARAEPLRLTMDDAVSRALTAERMWSASLKDIDVARAGLERSKAWMPSNPFLSSGAQHTTQSGIGPNYEFFLSQEVEIAGQRKKRVEAAAQGVEKAVWDAQSAEDSLAASVKTAFVQALVQTQRVTLAHKTLDAAAQLTSELAEHEHRSDTERMDLNIARIQETRARREFAAVDQALDSSFSTLRKLLNLPVDQQLDLVGAPRQEVKVLPPGAELVQHALEHRADLAALRHGVQKADRQLELVHREAIPNVTISATVSRFEGDTQTGGDIGMPIPVFQRKSGDLQEAVAEHERADLETQSLERAIVQEVRDARRDCASAGEDLRALQEDIVPKSEENVDIERKLYERGTVTLSELIGVQVDLLTARREQLDAVQNYNEKLIELERVTGENLKLL